MSRRIIFQVVKQLRGGKPFTMDEVRLLDAAIDDAFAGHGLNTSPVVYHEPPVRDTQARMISPKGIALIHSFESCKLDAYPDPGSKDGHPWTVGWGSTGPGIAKGVRWTQSECDARFEQDIAKYAAKVDAMLGGAKTNQNQFDAMVSLAYNIGTEGLRKSTVMRKHKAGDYQGASAAFVMWNKNDGKVMRGLTRRRLAEADLYDGS